MVADGAGIRFGQYVLLRRIARGGMAEVFLAQQRGFEGFDRRVAVKRILPHLADVPDFIKMFLDEARLAAQLTHPNIVHIYDFGKVDADYFIAMEYVDGVHAGQLCKRGETDRLSPAMIARLGADAAAALHHAHELRAPNGTPVGLVHRDVSPANLMVSFDGVVKLCDFGIAKAAAIGDRLTQPGQIKGKFAYMSPEQTSGAPLDGRSDVYSLAIVLWELLAGKALVPHDDALAAMRAIRDGNLMPIDRVAPWTPAPLASAITWALETRREQRPTAMQLAQALEAFIKSSPELATPMQLGSWLRARFPRELADQATPPPSGGTHAAPGTLAGPGTAVSRTGEPLIAASLVGAPPGPAPDTTSETIAVAPVHHAANAATVIAADRVALAPSAPPAPRLIRDPAPVDPLGSTVMLDDNETVMRSGAFRPQQPSGPAAIPTVLASPRGPLPRSAPAPTPVPHSSPAPLPRSAPTPALVPFPAIRDGLIPAMPPRAPIPPSLGRPTIEPAPRRSARAMLAFGGLVALAVLSFVIALAARGSSSATVTRDAALPQAAPPPIDAAPDAAPVDARKPTILPDADTTAILEVRTRPEGAMVKIGDQAHAAPSQFALPAGHYEIDAELDGWTPERRAIDLAKGDRVVQDIVFTTELAHGARPPRTGKLSARTTPPCEVYLGTRRLTETPFADLELEPGTYTLLFKHPQHATVIKNVTITAGKTTRLQLTLP